MICAQKGTVFTTDRDRLLCRYLFENRVATIDQLNRDVFGGVSDQNVYRRLGKLRRAGLIIKVGRQTGGHPSYAYSLSHAGFKEQALVSAEKMQRWQRLSDAVEHDLVLNDIRAILAKLNIVTDYATESIIESSPGMTEHENLRDIKQVHPDAILTLSMDQKTHHFVPLEYEASLKSIRRCKEKIANYHYRPNIELLLFVAKTTAIEERFRQIETELAQDFTPKVFFADLETVLASQGRVTFTNIRGKTLTLK